MERLMGGITIHKPVAPPAVILALGNGFDFWAIQAAKKWRVCIQLLTLSLVRILTLWPPSQKSRVIAHSLLGQHKDGMDAIIRSLELSDRVTYIRGDPSCVLLLVLVSATWLIVIGGTSILITRTTRLTWCGCPTAL